MTDEVLKELYRSRWRRARETLGIVNPGQNGFATGGLGGHVPHLTVRLLILPADPEVSPIEFDEPLWEWWKGGTARGACRSSPARPRLPASVS